MRIDIVSGLPKLLSSPLNNSIINRAKKSKKVLIRIHNLRKHAHDRHRTIDDTPYGGGAGMILKPEPVFECIENLQKRRKYDEIIYLTADGERFNQKIANELSLQKNLILLCGHYKGIDDRIRQKLITREISIGDYVLTGGELAALVVVDAVVRLVPGVVGDSESLLSDSFQDGLLDAPYYTKPLEYKGLKVPEVLLSGDHKKIEKWRQEQRLKKTRERRPDLLTQEYK
ncbi:MAG: tRNA (guanosine(37)-N1)-methyltransferase TrmD [Bacteroidetes bacterium]|nr:tRNA (guanosine(37)-N1)-methyltransferase TrmD [Bacteroidota bacterium]MBU1423165.1 tRNA (guanosine(37)-N1)-methyltransferase TrmD [Bacteroidota bacterium]MBU2635630.1 tRNA (guanosine(37)-N1)-methyltransferase TrmD [Bacteroidota bacterium]